MSSHQQDAERSRERAQHTQLGELLSSCTQFLHELLHTHKKVVSAHSHWSATHLAERFAQPEYQTQHARVALLRQDAEHFASEAALQSPIRRFQYTIQRGDASERTGSYAEPMSELLQNFIKLMLTQNGPPSRAQVEQLTLENIFYSLQSLADQTNDAGSFTSNGIVLTSPPDTKKAGYSGISSLKKWDKPEEHHTFFYLMQIADVRADALDIEVVQYQLWPNIRQILQLHQQLGGALQPNPQTVTRDIFANYIPINLSQLATLPIDPTIPQDHFATETPLQAKFRQQVFATAHEHKHSFCEQPLIDEDAFWRYHHDLFDNFYLKLALPLFDQAVALLHTKPLAIDEYADVIAELDSIFTWYNAGITRWVQHHNTNPLYKPDQAKGLMGSVRQMRNKLVQSLNTLRNGVETNKNSQQLLSAENMRDSYQIFRSVKNQTTVSAGDLQLLNSTLGFLGNISGKVQCGAGATLNIPFQALKQFSAFESLAGLHSFATIPLPDRLRIYQQLNTLQYVELDLRSQGAKRAYMVPTSYLQGQGCTVDPESGRVWGPCGQGEDRIFLDDPRDTMAYAMSATEFEMFRSNLQQSITTDSMDEISTTLTEKSKQDNHPELHHILALLHKYLFKHTLSIIEWLAGDYFREVATNLLWLDALKIKLQFAPNPFALFKYEVAQLLEKTPELLAQLHNPFPHQQLKAV